jgi:hypothetical protein
MINTITAMLRNHSREQATRRLPGCSKWMRCNLQQDNKIFKNRLKSKTNNDYIIEFYTAYIDYIRINSTDFFVIPDS